MRNVAEEQQTLDSVITKGRQENASLRSGCSSLQDEVTRLRSQAQV